MLLVLSESQAARTLGTTIAVLRGLRGIGKGPPYVSYEIESGKVRVGYLMEDLEAWARERRVTPEEGIRRQWGQ